MTPDQPATEDNSSNVAATQTEGGAPTPSDRSQAARGAGDTRTTAARTGALSGGLALILATIAVIGTGYLWYMLMYERQDLLSIDVPGALTRLETTTRKLQEETTSSDEQLKILGDTQETLQAALEKIQNDIGKNRTDWVIGEAEQLLLIGNRRLHLARDVNSALAALRAGDRQLELLADPKLLPVRREIAREIASLESLEGADVAGISLRLAGLAERVEQLPLALEVQRQQGVAELAPGSTAPSKGAEGANGPRAVARAMWGDMLSLVRIRTDNSRAKPLLAPEQAYFAHENLRLMLFGAQHALLEGHIPTYQQNLRAAYNWLDQYFAHDSPPVMAIRAEIETLRNARVASEFPNISTSLELLRKITRRRQS